MVRLPRPTFPLKSLRKGAKILFVVEALLFAGSYGVWQRMNTNRDFRYYMSVNYPAVLSGYYKVGEILDKEATERARKLDEAVWIGEKRKLN